MITILIVLLALDQLAYAAIGALASVCAAWITAHVGRLEGRVSTLERRVGELEATPRKGKR